MYIYIYILLHKYEGADLELKFGGGDQAAQNKKTIYIL